MLKKEVGPSLRLANHSGSVYLADTGAHGAKHTATIGRGASQKRTGWDGSLKETFPPFFFSKTIAGTLMLNRLVDSQPFVRSGRAAKRSLPLPPTPTCFSLCHGCSNLHMFDVQQSLGPLGWASPGSGRIGCLMDLHALPVAQFQPWDFNTASGIREMQPWLNLCGFVIGESNHGIPGFWLQPWYFQGNQIIPAFPRTRVRPSTKDPSSPPSPARSGQMLWLATSSEGWAVSLPTGAFSVCRGSTHTTPFTQAFCRSGQNVLSNQRSDAISQTSAWLT